MKKSVKKILCLSLIAALAVGQSVVSVSAAETSKDAGTSDAQEISSLIEEAGEKAANEEVPALQDGWSDAIASTSDTEAMLTDTEAEQNVSMSLDGEKALAFTTLAAANAYYRSLEAEPQTVVITLLNDAAAANAVSEQGDIKSYSYNDLHWGSSDITLDLNQHTLDASGSVLFGMNDSGAKVTIKNGKITNAEGIVWDYYSDNLSSYEGANTTVTVSDVDITAENSMYYVGAFNLMIGSSIQIKDSSLKCVDVDNSQILTCGMYLTGASLTADNFEIEAGLVAIYASDSDVKLTNSSVSAEKYGMYLCHYSSNEDNTAKAYQADLKNTSIHMKDYGRKFAGDGNRGSYGIYSGYGYNISLSNNCSVVQDVTCGSLYGIYTESPLTISDSKITQNADDSGDVGFGCGVYSYNYGLEELTLNMTNTEVKAKAGNAEGIDARGADVTLTKTNITSEKTNSDSDEGRFGGAIGIWTNGQDDTLSKVSLNECNITASCDVDSIYSAAVFGYNNIDLNIKGSGKYTGSNTGLYFDKGNDSAEIKVLLEGGTYKGAKNSICFGTPEPPEAPQTPEAGDNEVNSSDSLLLSDIIGFGYVYHDDVAGKYLSLKDAGVEQYANQLTVEKCATHSTGTDGNCIYCGKKNCDLSGVTVASKNYDELKAAMSGTLKVTRAGKEISIPASAVTYTWYEGSTKLSAAPVKAGSYKLVVSMETDEYYGSVEVPFTINATKNTKRNIILTEKNNALTIQCSKVKDAAGYDIYITECGKNFKKKASKTVKSSTTKVTVKKFNGVKVNDSEVYKARVKAYKYVNGKKVYITSTLAAHVAGTKNADYTNPKTVKSSVTTVTLTTGKSQSIAKKITVKKASSKKKLLGKDHTAKVRYYSSNNKIAKVSAKGKITAKGQGQCYVYAVGMNGKFAKIKVTVK